LGVVLATFSLNAAVRDAESFFHQGARHFLATNELVQARQAVTNGLQLHPDDPKLKKLWELLNQQQQSQNNQNQQDQKDESQQEQKQDQQQKQDEKQNQQEKPQPDQNQQEQKQEQQQSGKKPDEKKDEAQQQAQQAGEKGEDQKEGEDGRPMVARMTPQQAAQLLEMLKGEERTMIFTPPRTNRQDRVLKDW